MVRELASYAYSIDNVDVIASKDGRHILLSYDPSRTDPKQKNIVLWQVDALNRKNVLLTADKETTILDFALGAMLVLASNERGGIVIFSIAKDSEQRRFSVAGVKSISRARLSPDGKLVALVGKDENEKPVAVLVNADDGTVGLRFAGRDDERDWVTAVAFSPDSMNVAVGRWNGTAKNLERARSAAHEDAPGR